MVTHYHSSVITIQQIYQLTNMKNLYKFDTIEDYNNEDLPYTNVSYVSENDTVYYNDGRNEIEQQPLTVKITALESGYTECTFWISFDDEWNDNTIFKYKLNNGNWIDAGDYQHEVYINDIKVDDEIQIIANYRKGLRSIGIFYNNHGDWMNDGRVKFSGNWFSTVNGYDYKTNPHFYKNEEDYWDTLHSIGGERGGQIGDISDVWIPFKLLKSQQYYRFYSSLPNLITPTDVRLVVKDDRMEAFTECFLWSNITSATIGADHNSDHSFSRVFCGSSISTLTIEKLDNDLIGEIAPECSNLTTIYNYTNHYVKLTDNFNNMPQSGTLYYVDYGQDMAYTPSSMVPSGWTCTPIQNPNI